VEFERKKGGVEIGSFSNWGNSFQRLLSKRESMKEKEAYKLKRQRGGGG